MAIQTQRFDTVRSHSSVFWLIFVPLDGHIQAEEKTHHAQAHWNRQSEIEKSQARRLVHVFFFASIARNFTLAQCLFKL